jgi:O-antigen/teichoic acid export membrane protein
VLRRLELKGYVSWLSGGGWAVMDQGLFAASNFAISVLLARWLEPQAYGAFAVAYAIFWILGTLHTSMLTEPMMVFGPGRYRERLSEYLGFVVYGHVAFGVLAGMVLLLVGFLFQYTGSQGLSAALFGLSLAAPFILFQWLIRRVCYVYRKPYLAAGGGALYMVLTLAGIYLLYQQNWLFSATAFGLMGLASMIVSLFLLMKMRVRRPPLMNRDELIGEALINHWEYGRWAAPSAGSSYVSWSGYLLLLPIWGGLEASATFRALMNPITPLLQANTALSTFLLPSLVRTRGQVGFKRLLRFALAVTLFCSCAYWIFLGMLNHQFVEWLYGGRYEEYSHLLWVAGLLPVLQTVGLVFSAALRAIERPNKVFWADALSAVVAMTVGLAFLIAWDLFGALIGILVSQVAAAAAQAWMWRSSSSDEEESEHHERSRDVERESL